LIDKNYKNRLNLTDLQSK